MPPHKSSALLLAACFLGSQMVYAQQETDMVEIPAYLSKEPNPPEKPMMVSGLLNHSPLNRLFYLPTRDEPATPATWGHSYHEVDLHSKDGTQLQGWWIESKTKPSEGIVVFSHGNAGSMGHHLGFVMWLAASGYDILMYDYRGYGKSAGKIDRQGMIEDTLAALEFAGNRGRAKRLPVISYGHSMGGAKSLAAIGQRKTENLQAVITHATFTSYQEMARIFGGRLAAGVVSDAHSPIDYINKISPLPLLIVHGKEDSVVPFSQGLKLFKTAQKPKTMFQVERGSHGNSLVLDNEAYRKRMLTWLKENLQD